MRRTHFSSLLGLCALLSAAAVFAYNPNGKYNVTGVAKGKVGGNVVVNEPYSTTLTLNGKTISGKIGGKPVSLTLNKAPGKVGVSNRTFTGGSIKVVYNNKLYGFTVTGGKLTVKKNSKGKIVFNGQATGFGTGNAAGTDLVATIKGTHQ